MRRSLLGAHGQDPVVPDGLDMSPGTRSRPRTGSFADGLARTRGPLEPAPRMDVPEPAPVHDGAERRRAA
ncbi:MAG TPA: hypothetical protein VF257_09460 [Solirubrobacteraceae bacterium]